MVYLPLYPDRQLQWYDSQGMLQGYALERYDSPDALFVIQESWGLDIVKYTEKNIWKDKYIESLFYAI